MGNNPVNGVDPDGEFFGKLRATIASWFKGGTVMQAVNGGNWYLKNSDGTSKSYGLSGFKRSAVIPNGYAEAGKLQWVSGEYDQAPIFGGGDFNLGKYLYERPGLFGRMMNKYDGTDIGKELFAARNHYGNRQWGKVVFGISLGLPTAIIGGAELITFAPTLLPHAAKDGWHLGRLGYHSIGKTVAKTSGQLPGKYLHLNIKGRHLILNRNILRHLYRFKYLK
jgi:hypothetical protein